MKKTLIVSIQEQIIGVKNKDLSVNFMSAGKCGWLRLLAPLGHLDTWK